MFFVGSINPVKKAIIQLISGIKGEWNVACSGNFTFEKLLFVNGAEKINSNDVALYSRAIASVVLQDGFSPKCNDDELKQIFDEWPETRYKVFCEIVFAMTYKNMACSDNPYAQYMSRVFLKNSSQWYAKTCEDFDKKGCFDFKINSFFFGDFVDFLRASKPDSRFAIFAPTYVGGYEKMYKHLEEVFEYEHPQYKIFDSKTDSGIYEELFSQREGLVYTDFLVDGLERYHKSSVQPGNMNKKEVHLYSNIGAPTSYFRGTAFKPIRHFPIISNSKTEIKEVSFAKVEANTVEYYRDIFLSSKVTAKSKVNGLCFAFLADGEIFGFVCFAGPLSEKETPIYVDERVDFVIESSVPRLSKLLLYLIKSREIKRLLERYYVKTFGGIQTTVFTDKPCSMKYRGVFKKVASKDGKLIYRTEFEDLSMQEQFEKWKKNTSTKN